MRVSHRVVMPVIVASSLLGLGVCAVQAAPKPAAAKPPAAKSTAKQVVTGPVAVYWMDTTTSSGMTMSGMGQKPSMGSIMKMMGGGDNVSHSLRLYLGSNQAAAGEPAGDHLPPAALNGGKDLPLYYKPVKTADYTPTQGEPEQKSYEPPKGKILIFWGCGEHAPANQPVVIDLSKLTDPSARVAMMKQMVPSTIALDSVRPPSPTTYKSFGEWPNSKPNGSANLGGDASLTGAHAIKANYSPDIAFTLDQGQDFLPSIDVTGNAKDAAGAVPLSWTALPRSKGFVVTAVGGGQDTVVMWTSADVQTAWMGFSPDYLTAHDLDTLVARKAVLPGSATGCTVPAEVTGVAQGLLYVITAYGGDTVMSYPPRPQDVNTPWNIQWETKVRYRSTTGGMLGQNMGMMGGNSARTEDGNGKSDTDQSKTKKKKGSLFGEMVKQGVGSLIP